MPRVNKRNFDNIIRSNIKIITNLLSNMHTERSNLLNRMYDLQRDNATLEKLLQMQLLRLLSVQELSSGLTDSEFDRMTDEHRGGHGNTANTNSSDAYK